MKPYNDYVICPSGTYRNYVNYRDTCTQCPKPEVYQIVISYVAILVGCLLLSIKTISYSLDRDKIYIILIRIFTNYLSLSSVISPYLAYFVTTEIMNKWYFIFDRFIWKRTDCFIPNANASTKLLLFGNKNFFFMMAVFIGQTIVSLVFLLVKYNAHAKRAKLVNQALSLAQSKSSEDSIVFRENFDGYRVKHIWRPLNRPHVNIFTRLFQFLQDMFPIYINSALVTYTFMLNTSLKTIICTRTDEGNSLFYLPTVKCSFSDPNYVRHILIGGLPLVVIGVGTPLICFIYLIRNRYTLFSLSKRRGLGFLTNSYDVEYWYWELIIFLRKFICAIYPLINKPYLNMPSSCHTILFFSSIFFVAQAYNYPFDIRSDHMMNHFETFLLGSWVLNMIIIFYAEDFSDQKRTFGLGIIIVNCIAYVVSAVLITVIYIKETLKEHSRSPFAQHLIRTFSILRVNLQKKETVLLYKPGLLQVNVFSMNANVSHELHYVSSAAQHLFMRIVSRYTRSILIHTKTSICPMDIFYVLATHQLLYRNKDSSEVSEYEQITAMTTSELENYIDTTLKSIEKKKNPTTEDEIEDLLSDDIRKSDFISVEKLYRRYKNKTLNFNNNTMLYSLPLSYFENKLSNLDQTSEASLLGLILELFEQSLRERVVSYNESAHSLAILTKNFERIETTLSKLKPTNLSEANLLELEAQEQTNSKYIDVLLREANEIRYDPYIFVRMIMYFYHLNLFIPIKRAKILSPPVT